MKTRILKFFSPSENQPNDVKLKDKMKPTGYISNTGKVVLPNITLEELGIEVEQTKFKVGTDEGKRKIKSLYLVPTDGQEGVFLFEKTGRGAALALPYILQNGGVDYVATKYSFSVSIFSYTEGSIGYELSLLAEDKGSQPKPAYTGKPRGRKPKSAIAEVTE